MKNRKLLKLLNDPKLFFMDSIFYKYIEKKTRSNLTDMGSRNDEKVVLKVMKKNEDKDTTSKKFKLEQVDSSLHSYYLISKSKLALEDGDIDKAISLADRAVAVCQDNYEAYIHASRVRRKKDGMAFSLEYIEKGRKKCGKHVALEVEYADVLKMHGRFVKETDDHYNKLIIKYKTDFVLSLYLDYMWESRSAKKMELKECLVQRVHDSSDLKIASKLGAILYEKGEYFESLKVAKKIINSKKQFLIKRYPSWYSYVDSIYRISNSINDTKLVDLTNNIINNENAFIEKLQSAKSIAIVGNSPKEIGMYKGGGVDKADLVIRFNNYPSELEISKHYGKKCDVWVRSVGSWVEERDINKFSTVIVSGTNLINRGCNLGPYMDFLSSKSNLVFFNNDHQYKLIEILGAPPSAGLMMLYWIYSIRGALDIDTIYGFGFVDQLNSEVKNISNSPTGVRHFWNKEYSIFNSMIEGVL